MFKEKTETAYLQACKHFGST